MALKNEQRRRRGRKAHQKAASLDGSNQTPAVMAGRSYHNSIAPGLGFDRNPKLHTLPAATQETGRMEGKEQHTDMDQPNSPERWGKNSRGKPLPGSENPQAREGKENPRKGVCSILRFLGWGLGIYTGWDLDFVFSANLLLPPASTTVSPRGGVGPRGKPLASKGRRGRRDPI